MVGSETTNQKRRSHLDFALSRSSPVFPQHEPGLDSMGWKTESSVKQFIHGWRRRWRICCRDGSSTFVPRAVINRQTDRWPSLVTFSALPESLNAHNPKHEETRLWMEEVERRWPTYHRRARASLSLLKKKKSDTHTHIRHSGKLWRCA